MISINAVAPNFNEKAFVNGEIKEISLSDYHGKWVVLFFYPEDFTFVCPTELKELAEIHEKVKELEGEIISVSTDSVHVHKAWHENSEIIKKIKFPMVADPARRIVRNYGTLIEKQGVSVRATFLISPEGIVKAAEFHDNDIGRNSEETLRKLQAAKYVTENPGQLCPMNWKPGSTTIKNK
jgi:peroxiredoxin (alkyl hydroperoxide reductase subunit C)